MDDLSLDVNGYRINIRVGAIISQDDAVLVCRIQENNWWFLPGGRIKTGESSLDALRRELAEEVGQAYRILRPAICSENFFEEHGRRRHEICTYYEVEWLGSRERNQHIVTPEIFQWVRRDHVPVIDLKPAFLKDHIVNPRSGLELVIYRDDE